MLRLLESRKFNNQPQGNAMTDVHGYDIHSVPIVFHIVRTCWQNQQTYSVGFDIAYPRLVGIAKA